MREVEGSSDNSREKDRRFTCLWRASREEVRGGGDIGGVGELKDLEVTRVEAIH